MKFDTPATTNPIDKLKVVGRPIHRIDGALKVTGQATYAFEGHDPDLDYAYGYPLGAAIAKGRISSMDVAAAKAAPRPAMLLITWMPRLCAASDP